MENCNYCDNFSLAVHKYCAKLADKKKSVNKDRQLQQLMDKQSFVAFHGTIREFENLKEENRWRDTLRDIKDDMRREMVEKYFVPNGPVTRYGIGKGYQVVFLKPRMAERIACRLEIYQSIDKKSREKGIWSIPVVFMEDEYQLEKSLTFHSILVDLFGWDVMNYNFSYNDEIYNN